MKTFFLATASLLLAARLGAQSLDWFTVDGGGGMSSDGMLTFAGTAGQPDAGTMSDGALTMQGGFWPALATAPAVTSSGSGYKVFYSTQSATPSANFVGSINSDGSVNSNILSSATWPRISPDGTKFLYHPVNYTGNFAQNNLALFDLATRNSTTLFANGDYVVYYDWLPGGANVVFDYGCGIYQVATNNLNVSNLFSVDCYDDAPGVNPQDGSIAFHNQYQGLMLANGDGSNRRHMNNTVPGDYWPNWSADAQWIVFVNNSGYFKIKSDGTGRTNLWTLIPGASNVQYNGANNEAAACFSPDGQWVIAAFNLNGTNGIYAIAADGSGTVKTILTTGNATDQTYNFIGGVIASTSSGTPPTLTIVSASAGQATVSWTPATPGFVLQESPSLAPATWTNSASGAQDPVTISENNTTKFYRLAHP
jgi:Tol biopolymer transport system component